MRRLEIVRPTHPAPVTFFKDFSDALDGGILTNNGPYVQAFEAALTEHLGMPTIVFSSGQTALMTMLAAAGIRSGEVICPSFTFCATPHAVRWVGATPVFADIDADTLCLDPVSVRSAITGKTRAILGVDPYGIMCDSDGLDRISGGLPVFLDSAPSFGSTAALPRYFDAQIFSFHATKALSTMEGGALCSYDSEFIERAKQIRNFGQDAHGDCLYPGLNGKMLEICAIIGLKQLESWSQKVRWRMTFADELADAIADIPGVTVIRAPHGQHPVWLYRPILIEDKFGLSRDAVVAELKKAGINTRTYYRPCHTLSCYYVGQSLPVTEIIANKVIALPVYNNMQPDEIMMIADMLRKIQKDAAR